MPVIGFLNPSSANGWESRLRAFRQGLDRQGRERAVEYRWAENQFDRLPALAAELVRRQVAVIVTTGSPAATLATKAATTTIPIVFQVGDDPVKLGLVAPSPWPGGNLTGCQILRGRIGGKAPGTPA
jgi:ABC-type uncharacterized transport system substrate-binding protein